MTTKKVDDLTLDELNEQVALCQNWKKAVDVYCDGYVWINQNGVWVDHYNPCHNAQQAFEIVDREKISVQWCVFSPNSGEPDKWYSWTYKDNVHFGAVDFNNMLAAQMKCYVKSVKGETVEI